MTVDVNASECPKEFGPGDEMDMHRRAYAHAGGFGDDGKLRDPDPLKHLRSIYDAARAVSEAETKLALDMLVFVDASYHAQQLNVPDEKWAELTGLCQKIGESSVSSDVMLFVTRLMDLQVQKNSKD
jgi:hypothetical protein